ncbi:MAG: chemotaxis protein CheD [Firmicutes bacterium]|nr:chemotaxis protein CheD [Bacillota bacterium]
MKESALAAVQPTVDVGIGALRTLQGRGCFQALGIGSCVIVFLWHPASRRAAMAHVLLPTGEATPLPGKYANTAVPALVEHFSTVPAEALQAKLCGGARLFEQPYQPPQASIGARNVAAVKAALAQFHIAVVAEDILGSRGRSLWASAANGQMKVRRSDGTQLLL